MNCCQCQGIEELFSQQYVNKELARYRKKGPDKTTRILTEAIQEAGVDGLTLLDIGGGVGLIQYALLDAGVRQVMSVDASSAYLSAAKEEAQRRGLADRVSYRHGDFIAVAEEITPADIVTLDRVICCYNDMEKLVNLSAERAGKLYGLVYPRDTWWVKIRLAIENFFYWLQRNPYRAFVHSAQSVEDILGRQGLKRSVYHQTLVWQVVVYSR